MRRLYEITIPGTFGAQRKWITTCPISAAEFTQTFGSSLSLFSSMKKNCPEIKTVEPVSPVSKLDWSSENKMYI